MKRLVCLLFLILALPFLSVTGLAPASEISESRDFWKKFNEKTTDFSAAFEQLQQIGEERDFRDFEIVEDVPPTKIPFEDLTANQGEVSGFWYSGAECRALVTKDSFDFFEKTICPKLHKFLKGIASDVQAKTYTFVRDDTHEGYSDYLILCLYSNELDNDLDKLEKPAVVLIQSKSYEKIVNSKKGDSFDLDVTIYTLPNAYGNAIFKYLSGNIGANGKNVYTVVSYKKPDEKDESYRPNSTDIKIPCYSTTSTYNSGRSPVRFFSPWLNFGVSFETSPTSLYRGEDGLKVVTVSWDQKGNTSIEDAFIAEEKEEKEYYSPEKVQQRKEEIERRREEERQKAIDSMSPKLRTFLFCYPIVVIIATIGSIAVLIYGFMEFLHPTWYWLNKFRVVWQVITIIYLGFLSCFMSYSIYYRPNQFWGIWFTCGFLFLPFIAILLLSTPEERIRNAIDDATSDPDSRLFLMFLRPILKFIIVCFFGGALLHIFFWRRSLELIFRGLFPSAEGPEE